MDRLFWFSLLLTYLPVSESSDKENCLTQPASLSEETAGKSAVLECTVQTDRPGCSQDDVRFEWFVFKGNDHHHLDLSSHGHKFNQDIRTGSLHINSLHVNDSGIYHCAAVWSAEPTRGRQYVGPGTNLIVRGLVNQKVKTILLGLLGLLTVYSLAIVSVIIFKKCGCNLSICRGTYKTDKNNSTKKATKRIQFREVLEEMYKKKNLAKQKQTADKNEAASTDFSSSNDDIYQNV